MTDLLSASPLMILGLLIVLSWFTNSRALKILTLAYFFLYPVIIGNVSLPSDSSQISEYLGDILNYWFSTALNELMDYLSSQFGI